MKQEMILLQKDLENERKSSHSKTDQILKLKEQLLEKGQQSKRELEYSEEMRKLRDDNFNKDFEIRHLKRQIEDMDL